MRNLPLTFDCMYCSQKLGEDFAKFCGLLRIYELYYFFLLIFKKISLLHSYKFPSYTLIWYYFFINFQEKFTPTLLFSPTVIF